MASATESLSALLMGVMCTLWFYFCILIGFLSCLLIQITLSILLFPLFYCYHGLRQRVNGKVLQACNSLAFGACFPFWNVVITREGKSAQRNKKTVFVANHTSSIDSWVLSYCLAPHWPLFVTKASIFNIPIVGWTIWLAGYPSIRFTNEKGGWGTEKPHIRRMMEECHQLIENGHNLIVFPEGTRSISGRLQPFKLGFFKFAVEHGYEIQPIAMHNNRKLWPLKSVLMSPGTSYCAFGDPISPKDKTVEELSDLARREIFRLLEKSPIFDSVSEQPLEEIARQRGLGTL